MPNVPGYLGSDYLEVPYLSTTEAAELGMQARMIIAGVQDSVGMQSRMIVGGVAASVGMQGQMWIKTLASLGMQAQMIRIARLGMQGTMVLYNITQLRVMTSFASRGIPAHLGNNWTATNTATGDFAVRNLNTDIVEQVYRSTTKSIELICNTGLSQGVPVNTIAILNHNLTRSAIVQVQGSKDNFATPPSISFLMSVEDLNMFWVSPEFPTYAGQNQWWKFIIQDSTNPDGYIEIGTIIFGVADIFNTYESFENPIVQSLKHFKDVLPTEGFTNVMNDRALKRSMRLDFRNINRMKQNWAILEAMMRYARTSLKCLIIPTPEFPSRFAIFAKLTNLPETSHQSIDADTEYVAASFDWDESL